KSLCVAGKKVQKIPLRHESDEFAACRQTREIGYGNRMAIKYSADFTQFLVGQPKKFLKQSELMQKLEGGRMNGVASEIAVEIGVFFQNNDVHSGARQQKPGHHAGWSAADDEAADADVRERVHPY